MKCKKKYISVLLGTMLAATAAAELIPGDVFGYPGTVSADPEEGPASYAAMNMSDGQVYEDYEAGTPVDAGSVADLLMVMTMLDRGLNPEGEQIFKEEALARVKESDPVLVPAIKAGETFAMPDAVKVLLGGQATEFRYQFSEGYAPGMEDALFQMIREKEQSLSLTVTELNSLDLTEENACVSSAGEMLTIMINAVGNYPVLNEALKYPADHSVISQEGEVRNWSGANIVATQEDPIEGLEYAFVLRKGDEVIGQISIATRNDIRIITSATGVSGEEVHEVAEDLFDKAFLKAYEPGFEENAGEKKNVTVKDGGELRSYPSASSEAAGVADESTVLSYAGSYGGWNRLKTLSGTYVYTQSEVEASELELKDPRPVKNGEEETESESETEAIEATEEEPTEAPVVINPSGEFEEQENNRSAVLAARMARQKRQKLFTFVAVGAIILSLVGLFLLHRH